MPIQHRIDALYADFLDRIPAALRPTARALPRLLGLTLLPELPWSVALEDAVVAGMPLLLADVRPDIPSQRAEAAATAHLLGIIRELGEARVKEGALTMDSPIALLLGEMWKAQCAAMAVLDAEPGDSTLQAMAANLPEPEQAAVAALIEGISQGRMLRRDAVCWPDAGVWTERVAGDRAPEETIEAWLHRTGTLVAMLRRAEDAFQRASSAATTLGCRPLAQWATDQAILTAQLAAGESRSAGLAVRWEKSRQAKTARRHLRALERYRAAA